jgi:lysophospholipase L1-like esterase
MAVTLGMVHPARAEVCPTPGDFVIAEGGLPATRAAVRQREVTILILGGAATLGGPARGAEFTYPARLTAHLQDALPGVKVRIVVSAVPRQLAADLRLKLDASLAAEKPDLVIWAPGANAAGRGDDPNTFNDAVASIIEVIRASGADLILMTLQYAPSVARVINLYPYRMTVIRNAEVAGVPVFDRYEVMRFWSDNDFLNLDVIGSAERVQVARTVYDCIARILAKGIVGAVR